MSGSISLVIFHYFTNLGFSLSEAHEGYEGVTQTVDPKACASYYPAEKYQCVKKLKHTLRQVSIP